MLESAVYQTVKLFIGYLLANIDKELKFKCFPDVFLAAAILNSCKDSRYLLSTNEKQIGRTFVRALANKVSVAIDTRKEKDQVSCTSENNPIDDVFAEVCLQSKRPRIEAKGLSIELEEFEDTIDEKTLAFDFF